MADFIVILVLVLTVGAAVRYIVKEKKKGVRCIGCPSAGVCAHKQNGGCGCHSAETHGSGCGCGCHSNEK